MDIFEIYPSCDKCSCNRAHENHGMSMRGSAPRDTDGVTKYDAPTK